MTLTFGYCFDQIIDSEMLPPNLKNINFDWLYSAKYVHTKDDIEMINNIPSYYHIVLLDKNIFDIDGAFVADLQ